MPIELTSVRDIPGALGTRLAQNRQALERTEHIESLYHRAPFASIVQELDQVCVASGAIGYHYSRSFPKRIMDEGFVASTGAERREAFLEEFGLHFTEGERHYIARAWSDYFDDLQNEARDSRVWFALTLEALKGRGAERLLGFYGGEVIFMPLTSQPTIAAKLQRIGEPLVVTCALGTSLAYTMTDHPWGKVWLATYHRSVNAQAQGVDFDIYMEESVPPSRILDVKSAHSVKAPGAWGT